VILMKCSELPNTKCVCVHCVGLRTISNLFLVNDFYLIH